MTFPTNYNFPNVLSNTHQWFEKVYPESTDQNRTTQMGVHFEEVAEMIEEITPKDQLTLEALLDAKVAVQHLADRLKNNAGCAVVEPENRKGFIDALGDQLVTAVGCAFHEGMDILGGLNEVNRGNFSKFVNGKPIFDQNMKVKKGPDYIKPDLTPFV